MYNVLIILASDKDFPMLLELLYELGRPKIQKIFDVEIFNELITKYVNDPNKMIFVAEFNNLNIVGMVSVMFLSRLNHLLWKCIFQN